VTTAIHRRVALLRAGNDPTCVARMASGWAVLGEQQFLRGYALLATQALRINYAMFGNVEPALHAHVVPRFLDEPAHLATAHPWSYDWAAAPRFDPASDSGLLNAVRRGLGLP
jgi:hypothetical protein